MKRCLHLITALLLVSLAFAPLGEVHALSVRAEREIRTDVPTRTVQHFERHSEPKTTKLGLREGHDAKNTAFVGSNNQYNEIAFATGEASGTSTDPYLEVTYLTDEEENTSFIPSDLETEEMTNPVNIVDTTPEFTAINDHPGGTDATDYQIQVSASSTDWSSVVWDSGKHGFLASIDVGNRTIPVSYAGPALASSTIYFWRIKLWDFYDTESAWSSETASFSISSGGISVGLIEDRTYTYDKVGNITQIVDTSLTHSAGTTTYAYDDLYRLTTATITGASSTPYTHTYVYDAIGNFASSSELGQYLYTGDTASDEGTKWANPHAVTGITPTTSTTTGPLTYDKNGNTTASNPHSDYLASTHVWHRYLSH